MECNDFLQDFLPARKFVDLKMVDCIRLDGEARVALLFFFNRNKPLPSYGNMGVPSTNPCGKDIFTCFTCFVGWRYSGVLQGRVGTVRGDLPAIIPGVVLHSECSGQDGNPPKSSPLTSPGHLS